MKTRLFYAWELLRTSYWFVPAVMTLAAGGLSLVALSVDRHVREVGDWAGIFGAGPDGARALLSTIAGSTITVAGVIFSVTIVALAQASSQFGPRLLRNFIRDPASQFVLGTFIATFVYCLLVLRTVDSTLAPPFVPEIAITVALVLAILSLGMLIYFIHHVATSIQADQIISSVTQELLETIRTLFPEEIGHELPPEEKPRDLPPSHSSASSLEAKQSGYLGAVNGDALIDIAQQGGLVITLRCRPGQFILEGTPIAVLQAAEPIPDDLRSKVLDHFIITAQRTAFQDVGFCVEQLTQIATRALSPSINDPDTAVTCINYLGVGLSYFVRRKIPSPYRYDGGGQLRVIGKAITFAELLQMALQPIRNYGAEHLVVMARTLEILESLAHRAWRQADLQAIQEHANALVETAKHSLREADHEGIRQRFTTLHSMAREHVLHENVPSRDPRRSSN